MVRRLLSILSVATAAVPFTGPSLPPARVLAHLRGAVLVELKPNERAAVVRLHRAHARLVARELSLWRVQDARTVVELARHGDLAAIERERLANLATTTPPPFDDPLFSTEWWRAAVGADDVTPPAAGVPITIVDSGLDLSHPEFSGRPNTSTLNTQSLTDTQEDFHGTAVASVAAAPANAKGIVGIYPTAALRAWDARRLSNTDVIAGILKAARRGPTVINLSLGYPEPDPMLEQAVLTAFGEGSIVVAAAGNDYMNGNPLIYPASLPHVLTVAATNESNRPASFSSASEAVDLAAPGQDIVAALPLSYEPSGWRSVDGTSFAAPIVSAATAWVWTAHPRLDNTQVFDLMRASARDIWHPGFDPDTGFGLLDLPAALSATPPPPDPQEPNDDIYEVKANGLFRRAVPPLTHGTHRFAKVAARLDVTEDPDDVYRAFVGGGATLRAKTSSAEDVDLRVWSSATHSVSEADPTRRRDLLARSESPGASPESVTFHNSGRRGIYVYIEVAPGDEPGNASYTLTVSSAKV